MGLYLGNDQSLTPWTVPASCGPGACRAPIGAVRSERRAWGHPPMWGHPTNFCRVLEGRVPENKGETVGTVYTVRCCAPSPYLPYRFVGKFLLGHGLGLDLEGLRKSLCLMKCGVFPVDCPTQFLLVDAIGRNAAPCNPARASLAACETTWIKDCRLGALRQGNSCGGTRWAHQSRGPRHHICPNFARKPKGRFADVALPEA